jgi:hypothetical protein
MNNNYPSCPKCGKKHYKVCKLPHPLLLHYILNPGIAVSEILLGVCFPKVALLCQSCQLPLYARGYVPCPHCRAMHDARLWTHENAFGNWRGYICPCCNKPIPRLWNVFSVIILIVLAPIWYFPYRFLRKKPYLLARKNLRISVISEPTAKTWIIYGVWFGFFMWLINGLIPATIQFIKTQIFPISLVFHQALIGSIIGGLCFSGFIYFYCTRKPQ